MRARVTDIDWRGARTLFLLPRTRTHTLSFRHRTHRGISEVGLLKLDAKTRRDTVVAGLRALSTLNFYPEQVDALIYFAKTQVR